MRPQRTPPRGAALGTLAVALGCATPGPAPAPPEGAPPPAGALRARLVFGDDADLDLYVTSPDLETVYFANTPTRLGGALEADVRCGTPPPRVETVAFASAPPGRWRIGVDFPERCRRVAGAVPFVLVVESDALRREERGAIEFGHFLPTVLEFDLPADRTVDHEE